MGILKKINTYNNTQNIEISKKLNIKKNYNIKFDDIKDNITDKDNILTLYDNKKKILSCSFTFFGIYQPYTQLWIWASSIPGINQKYIKIINDIKKSSYLFENDDDPDILFIYQLLTNDVILLPDTKYFDLINKTLNYLSNSIIVLNPINKSENTQFIAITKILEQYI